jgi:hypothetical protein
MTPREVELEAEVARLRRVEAAVRQAAQWLRGPVRADTMNEAIRALNAVLPGDEKILEICWGTASLGALQQQIKNLYALVGLEDLSFPVKHIGPLPLRRQVRGGSG